MKNLIISILCFASAFSLYADMIITKSGQTMTVYNIEVGASSIFYTEEPSSDSPLKKIAVAEVFGYKIGDGEMQTVEASQPATVANPESSQNSPNTATPTITVGDSKNAELLASYSAGDYSYDQKPNDKSAKGAIIFYSLTKESVLSNDDVEITLETGYWRKEKSLWLSLAEKAKGYSCMNNNELKISIYNKTDNPLYIDLSRTIRNGEIPGGYRAYYDGTQTSQGGSSSTGIGAGVLGIGIGSSSSSSAGITKNQSAVLTIPPHNSVDLPRYGEYSDYDKKVYEYYDKLGFSKKMPFMSKMKDYSIGQVDSFNESNSPSAIDFMVTYSDSQTFDKSKTIDFHLYISRLIAIKQLLNIWSGKWEDRLDKLANLDSKAIVSSINLSK